MWENVSKYHFDIALSYRGRGVQGRPDQNQAVCLSANAPTRPVKKAKSTLQQLSGAQLPFYIHTFYTAFAHNRQAASSCALHAQNVSGEKGIHRLTYATDTCLAPCRPGPGLPTPADVSGNFLEAQAEARDTLRYNAQGSGPYPWTLDLLDWVVLQAYRWPRNYSTGNTALATIIEV